MVKHRLILYPVLLAGLLSLLPSWAWATSAGDASSNLFTPTLIATRLAIFACYIIGVGMILAAGVQYKQHRQSPKLVPLTTPILLVLLGLCLVLLPYFSTVTQDTFSAIEQDKRDNPYADPQKGRLPLPPLHGEVYDQEGNIYHRDGDDTSNYYEDPDESHWSNESEYNEGGGSHWSNELDYR